LKVDLRPRAGLEPADGVIFIAAHLSRAETLTEWLDPSVTDELDPDRRESEFDIYESARPHQQPYMPEFIERFRAAQIARNRKITGWCQEWLGTLRRRRTSEVERCFVVHRTMCDVRWLDPRIDPNGRRPGWCYLGDPRTVNTSPTGLARYSSLRSWLSQWSYDLSNAKGPKNAARIRTRRYCRSRTSRTTQCLSRTIRRSARPLRPPTRNMSGSKVPHIIIRTSLPSCTNASVR
jgi:hypothetical protein